MKTRLTNFTKDTLKLDAEAEVARIVAMLRKTVLLQYHRLGAVVGLSGGVDSAVVAALCAQAFGPSKVLAVLMPEKESSPESVRLAQEQADRLGIRSLLEDITASLTGSGCYARRDEAVRRLFPQFGAGWKIKIVLPNDLLGKGSLNIFHLVLTDPDGNEFRQRLPVHEFRQIMAASNFKQRTRMAMLYYHAELENYAVIGTANKNEHDMGFFVKYGDGGCDVNPIVHLFKTQVFQLAGYLQVVEEIQKRTPTTDTYPGAGSQEEFFYRIPFELLDTIWRGYELGLPEGKIADAVGLERVQVERVILDIAGKKRTTEYLRSPVGDVTTIE